MRPWHAARQRQGLETPPDASADAPCVSVSAASTYNGALPSWSGDAELAVLSERMPLVIPAGSTVTLIEGGSALLVSGPGGAMLVVGGMVLRQRQVTAPPEDGSPDGQAHD